MTTARQVILVVFISLALVGLGLLLWTRPVTTTPTNIGEPEPETIIEGIPTEVSPYRTVGTSVEGREIVSYTAGTGSTTILFVGGIHGGYEWNSSVLAYEFISELEAGTFAVPANIRVVVIPTLNPDGLFAATGLTGTFTPESVPENDAHTTGQGRFNANDVDLNRNFDCKWKPESTWRSKAVSAGTAPFSEPEAAALAKLVSEIDPAAVIFWHSQANAVYGSECEAGILPQTLSIMKAYAEAASYAAVPSFDAYPVSGDAEGWLASIGIPAITVELETRTSSEWTRNRAGVQALLNLYTNGKQ